MQRKNDMRAFLLLLLAAALLAFGCVQQQPAAAPSPTPSPTAAPVPTQTIFVTQVPSPTPTPLPPCVFANDSCCRGSSCTAASATCAQGLVARLTGCDANCSVIVECVAVSSPTPTPAPQLNPVYLGATTAFYFPEELDFAAKRVFEYRNGSLRLPTKIFKSAPEPMGTEYFVFKFEWEPDYYIKDRLERFGAILMHRLGNATYVVRSSGGSYYAIKDLTFVNWSAVFQPAQKIGESLFYATGLVRAKITLFRGEDGDVVKEISELASEVHSTTAPNYLLPWPEGGREVVVTLDASAVPDVAAMRAVYSIEEV